MSANDALAELAGPPRDRWGRYLLPHPEHPDDKPRSFTRATTVAKAPEDQGGLIKWGQRTVVAGLGRRADLVALAATTDPTDKKALGQIARDAEEAGGAATGRNTGTAIHAAIEAVNRGDEPLPLFAEEVQAYRDALAARGLEPVSDLVERIVVDADREIAGTFDVALRDTTTGELFVADLKTGSVAYPASMAIQLAIYANATHLLARNFTDYEPMPQWSKTRGVILHLPPGGPCTPLWIDLVAGARGLKIAMQVRSWRSDAKAKALLDEVATGAAGTAAGGPADAEVETVAPPSPSVSAPSPDHAGGVAQEQSDGARLEWFDARYDEILAAGVPKAKIAEAWPDGLPTPKARDTWTSDQLEHACKVVTELHHGAGLAFPPPDPAAPAPARPSKLRRKPKATKTLAAPKDCEDLVAAYHALDKVASTDVTRWQGQGVDAGRPWSAPTEKVSRWHWAVNSAAVGVARHAEGDTEIARGWIALVIGEDDCQTHPIGALLGSLSTSEAEKLAALTQSDTFAAAVAAA